MAADPDPGLVCEVDWWTGRVVHIPGQAWPPPMKNIAAYTEPGASSPGYLSINVDAQGAYSISVRTRGDERASILAVPPAVLRQVAEDLLRDLGTRPAPADWVWVPTRSTQEMNVAARHAASPAETWDLMLRMALATGIALRMPPGKG